MFARYAESPLTVSRVPPALALLLSLAMVCMAKGPDAPLRIPLESFGFQPPGKGAMAIDGMSTVTFLDNRHLLVTSVAHRLMRRLPDCPPTDQDRIIDAAVVDLPSGEVLARTEWRVHDLSQYLWNLGHGRVLLRIRGHMTTMAPLANLRSGHPFAEQPFLMTTRRVAAILFSPDHDLMTVETLDPLPPNATSESEVYATLRTQVNFYRLTEPAELDGPVTLRAAGVNIADAPVNLSLTGAGHIETSQEDQDSWTFDFDPYQGKYLELSSFETSCRPLPMFVSASEFVAFGCRGGDERLRMGGFDLGGNQMWQAELSSSFTEPTFAVATEAGRFALSRDIVVGGDNSGMTVNFAPADVTTQEIRVYQMYDGQQLLQTEALPVQHVKGNFDLSPDGMKLAVLHGEELEVDSLPPLTSADKAAVAKAHGLQPKAVLAAVNLSPHPRPGAKAVAMGEEVKPVPVTPVAAAPQAPETSVMGDALPVTHRKRPTLYTLPTDHPEQSPQQEEQANPQ